MVPRRTLAAIAAALSLTTSASGFDAKGKSNVAVYYGQGENQPRLSHFCQDTSLDIINIGFVNTFPGQGAAGWPGSNFGNQCDGNTYEIGGVKTQLLSGCHQLMEDIPICQAAGKKILLSLGGGTPDNQKLLSDTDAVEFADFLWGAFGPVDDRWTAAGGPRPFGDVVVDGFDFDIEHNGGFGYAIMVNRFREHFNRVPDRRFYISGAPQCPIPDQQLSLAIANSVFDFVWVQFYNTEGCSARKYFSGSGGRINERFNYDSWVNFIQNGGNPATKLYIGLPASEKAANPGYYLSPREVDRMVAYYMDRYPDAFGGIMLWEATASERNRIDGINYAGHMKNILVQRDPAHPTPTTPTPTSIPVTSSTSTAPTGTHSHSETPIHSSTSIPSSTRETTHTTFHSSPSASTGTLTLPSPSVSSSSRVSSSSSASSRSQSSSSSQVTSRISSSSVIRTPTFSSTPVHSSSTYSFTTPTSAHSSPSRTATTSRSRVPSRSSSLSVRPTPSSTGITSRSRIPSSSPFSSIRPDPSTSSVISVTSSSKPPVSPPLSSTSASSSTSVSSGTTTSSPPGNPSSSATNQSSSTKSRTDTVSSSDKTGSPTASPPIHTASNPGSETTAIITSATSTVETTASATPPGSHSGASSTTTVIVTSYTNICPTGFTTITTTYTSTYGTGATATIPPVGPGADTTALPPPEGWTATITVCTHCAPTPTTVTLTLPVTTATEVAPVPHPSAGSGSAGNTGIASGPNVTPTPSHSTSASSSPVGVTGTVHPSWTMHIRPPPSISRETLGPSGTAEHTTPVFRGAAIRLTGQGYGAGVLAIILAALMI
ncbi:class III chitinase ChiA1 [Aspergillus tanneri]|uniref:chitinase n=1 Tax=Aspergillus tanneri TaxID=1220188 RepID=A0A5M9MQM3_9EURO|nr:uncharacterized protein ATNIH1004_006294 [Aspergillus tanneri]KAA8647600.1 hypothetical protein ATNIH1004_006294 [Aspergillus tanneri]